MDGNGEPRISLITVGVTDLQRSLRFYRDGLGWPVSGVSGGDVAFLGTGGATLALYPRDLLAADAWLSPGGSGFGGIALAHNVTQKELVDEVRDHRSGGGISRTMIWSDPRISITRLTM